MTLQLHKKPLTTLLNIQRTTSRSFIGWRRLRISAVLMATALSIGNVAFAATSDSSSSLSWGSPGIAKQAPDARVTRRPSQNSLRSHVVRDSQVVAANWEDDASSLGVQQAAANEHQSIVVERNSPVHGAPNTAPPAYDPFDEDDRLAQLPDDPFNEPERDEMRDTEFEEAPVDDMEAVEDAVEQEIQRRRSREELLDQDMEDSLEIETIDSDPIDPDPIDDFEDVDPLSDNPDDEDEDLLQSENEDWKTPDFDLNRDNRDQKLTPEELQERSEEMLREQQESEDNCHEELEKVEADTISSIDLSIRVKGNAGEDYPYECAVSTGTHQPRQWPGITYNWKAAAICHKPLYFEQVQLERYGHSWGPYVQPIMSGVHFFGTIPILPYKMGIRTPRECVYTLGYYRPGSCAPYMIDPIPFTWRAALMQGGAATGISFVIP